MIIHYPILRAMALRYQLSNSVSGVLIDECLLAHKVIEKPDLKENDYNSLEFHEGDLHIELEIYIDTRYYNVIVSDIKAYYDEYEIDVNYDYEKLEMFIEEWFYQEPTHTSDEFLKPVGS